MKYSDKDISMLKKTYDESQISAKKDNLNFSKTVSELESRISELESSLEVTLNELDYIKNGRNNVLTKQEVENLFKMMPPTTQRSVNIPVPIDQGGTGVTTLAEAQALIGALTTVDLTADVTGILPVANGGTGQAGIQAAIDSLTSVSSATNEHVLTKDTATGNAIFKAPSGGVFTDSGTTAYLTTTTDDMVIGASSPVSSAKLSVDGDADQIQCLIQGNSTQTSDIFVVEKSDGTDLFKVSNTAGITVGGTTAGILDTNGNELVLFTATSSAVNEVTLANAATGNDPSLTASGGDSNVGIDLVCKGTGGVTLRHEPRITTITSSATPTINTDNCDAVTITALAAAITSMTTNLSGTPKNFQRLVFRIKDDGTARAITWGSSFEACGYPLPSTTVISKRLTALFIYDSVSAKWGCISASQEA